MDTLKNVVALKEELNRRLDAVKDLEERIRKEDEDSNKTGVHADNSFRVKKFYRDQIYQLSKLPQLTCPTCNGCMQTEKELV